MALRDRSVVRGVVNARRSERSGRQFGISRRSVCLGAATGAVGAMSGCLGRFTDDEGSKAIEFCTARILNEDTEPHTATVVVTDEEVGEADEEVGETVYEREHSLDGRDGRALDSVLVEADDLARDTGAFRLSVSVDGGKGGTMDLWNANGEPVRVTAHIFSETESVGFWSAIEDSPC